MDFDRLERFDRLGRYEKYLRYMQLMDSMDMMEGVCDNSMEDMNESPIQNTEVYRRQNVVAKRKINSNVSKRSEDDVSDDNFESDSDGSSSDSDSVSLEPPKKKIDIENPYRGLKDSGNPLETMEDAEFLTCYKFSKKTIYDVMELIKQGLIKHTNRGTPVPPLIELLITLKYLTTGSIQKNAMSGVSQATISRINTRVTKLIVALQNRFIRFPDKSEVDAIKVKFYERGKFPEVVGCLGSTHVGVRVKGIKDYHAGFVNENGYHSVRVQLIVGPDSEILDIVSKWPGSTHENQIFNLCEVNQKFQAGEVPGVLLGNYAYNPTAVIMTCIKHPQHTGEFYYNEALSKSYTAGECIMEWKKRFRCLQTFLACKTHTQQNIITCCAILHNIAKSNNDPLPIEDEQSVVIEVKGKKECPKKRIEIPMVENIALVRREEFVRKHFPTYCSNPTVSYLSL